MPILIELTDVNVGKVYINVDAISSLYREMDNTTNVYTTQMRYHVTETPKQILEMIPCPNL